MRNLTPRRLTGWLILGTTAGMAIPLTLWWLRDPERFVSDLLGFSSDAATIPWGWAAATLVVIGYVLYTLWAVPFVRHHATRLSGLKLLAIPLALVTGTLEELLFRKFLMDGLDQLGAGAVLQVIGAAIAFGLAHSVWVVFSRDATIIVPVIAATTALGAALGATYLLSDRIALPVIVAHIVINLVIEPWLLLSAVNGMWRRSKRDLPASVSRR
ncbi:CPBP family glutamic-type intramembrane protease [Microbacterium jiangjiandongii]|uniref:CPBP family glutamic-type intramembrane protease n=1 Tax=Microbacterium jiangjiandongii TaxID=3049071 RepID=UPI00214C3647|nr:CPBP family glutamic-type intramembrane protease [Microbacterium sp. zg.Y843]MCR2815529.1 CPBP family glutamic-type intramembrane protease [Microbacterium sp. zg.Y843]